MADGINISLGEVSQTAASIRNINQVLDARLSDIKAQMNSLTSTWQSDAANTMVNNFNALVPKFEEYKNVVESYAKFLDYTVNSYDTAETAINNNASAFK
jgi:WXG100 family type VII secretion target